MSKPSLARGTRDFGPEQMAKRTFIFDTIRRHFKRYGFQPLETPAFENLSVLMGKYGDEGDQLLFKILNSGDFAGKLSMDDWQEGSKPLTRKISEKGLRYDLTVPFARYVAMNRGTLILPFKRYQIQPVWRADRPQRGRYREFYQCDADVVGTDSLLCEAEIILLLHETLSDLGIDNFTIKVNNRKVLAGIAQRIGAQGKEGSLYVAIDKLDKIGKDGVISELYERGFSVDSVRKLAPLFELSSYIEPLQALNALNEWLWDIDTALHGISELVEVWNLVKQLGLEKPKIQFDVTLARGLSYYTGAIFEVKANNVQIGSISGGGRYDNLTGSFGYPGVSGVGISLGVDRIYDVMEELNLFPRQHLTNTKVMIAHVGESSFRFGLSILGRLRKVGINAEIYPDAVKVGKQFDFADRKNIPFVIIVGSEEMASGFLKVKNMRIGEQFTIHEDRIYQFFSQNNLEY